MKARFISIALFLSLIALQACRENNPITLHDEIAFDDPLDALFLREEPDTTNPVVREQTKTSVDVTGLLRRDDVAFPGTILVTNVKSDLPDGRVALSYARILLRDTSTITAQGGWGFFSAYRYLDVGRATLDDIEFDVAQVIVELQSWSVRPTVVVGVIHKLGNDGKQPARPITYIPRHRYKVGAEGKKTGVQPFDVYVTSPDEITITNLRPHSILFRDEDFVLRWSGEPGQLLRVMVSTYNDSTGRAESPLVVFTARPSGAALRIPSKLLRLIPATPNGKHLLSLVSANRSETQIGGYPEKVLVQAASIHNVVVLLR